MDKLERKSLRGRVTTFTPKKMDEDEFRTLFNLLHEVCFNCNFAATARTLGISPITARKWDKKPPKRGWETYIVRTALKHVMRYMSASIHKKYRQRTIAVQVALKASGYKNVQEEIEAGMVEYSKARTHVMSMVAHSPSREISSDQLFSTANNGGYGRDLIRMAAKQLGIKRETKGFGKHKTTYYFIPRPNEDYEAEE